MIANLRGSLAPQHLDAVFSLPLLAVAEIDFSSGHFLRANARFCKLAGRSGEELRTLRLADILHADDRVRYDDVVAALVGAGEAGQDIEQRYLKADGEVVFVRVAAKRVRDDAGRESAVCVVLDVTLHERDAEALREGARRKNDFLATLAHELRNPLAPIANALQLLGKETDVPAAERRRAHEIIGRQVRHMVRLVDDLLDVSRISTGRIRLRRERIDIRAAIENAVETSRPLIEAARHELVMDLPSEPVYVEADATRLSQVILNLLNNAARYTPRGGRIELAVMRDDGDVVLRVRDSGIGIARDMLPRVFDMFVQDDRASAASQEGLGVGLALARQLTELHGGRLEADSDGAGRGSEFTVRLPASGRRSAGMCELPRMRLRDALT